MSKGSKEPAAKTQEKTVCHKQEIRNRVWEG